MSEEMAVRAGKLSFVVEYLAAMLEKIADGTVKPRDAAMFARSGLSQPIIAEIVAAIRNQTELDDRVWKIFHAAQGELSYADALEQAETELSEEISEAAFFASGKDAPDAAH